jgi:osmotically-inducible protein OsmY
LYGIVASDTKIKNAVDHAKNVEGVRSVKSVTVSKLIDMLLMEST